MHHTTGDLCWNCRTCQTDPTCVQCDACFQNSDHTGHDVYFHHASPVRACEWMYVYMGMCMRISLAFTQRPRRVGHTPTHTHTLSLSLTHTQGGCCDCGDLEAWKQQGCCPAHAGPDMGQDPTENLPPQMVAPAKAVFREAVRLVTDACCHAVQGFNRPEVGVSVWPGLRGYG